LIDDPRQCKLDLAKEVPACKAGSNGNMCLTASQAAAIQKVYDGPKSGGKAIFPGYMLGSEALVTAPNGTTASGWANLLLPTPTASNAARLRARGGASALPVFPPAAAGLRLPEVRLRPRPAGARALGQDRERDRHEPHGVPRTRWQADHDLRLGRPDPAAAHG